MPSGNQVNPQPHADQLIHVDRITKTFGGVTALDSIEFEIKKGQIKALIGPNGAGKSTMMNIISGILTPDDGHIVYKGKDLVQLRSHQIASLGISRTFQLLRLFTANSATVFDNLMIGAHLELQPSIFNSIFPGHARKHKIENVRNTALEMLDFIGLKWAADHSPLTLSFGNQRLVEIGRALMSRPTILLLDEAASGLNDTEVNAFKRLIFELKNRGVTILIVEHNMKLIMDIADEIVVLNFGSWLAEGSPSDIAKNPDVIAAYLGKDHSGSR